MSVPRWLAAVVMLSALGCGQSAPLPTAEKPQRIVSLTLATDELLPELVPLERIAGVTHLVDDPQISNVAGRYPASVPRLRDTTPERVLGLAPELVCVAPYNSADFLKVIERSGLSVYRNEALHGIDQVETGIVDLGKRVGEPERAAGLVERMRGSRKRLAEQLAGVRKRPRVLYWSAGFTSGRQTTLDDAIREAGAENVAVERDLEGSAEISPEQVLLANPEFILLSRWSADDRQGRIENHPILRNLKAVREGRVITLDGRYLLSVSHYVIEGAEQLARKLHPDRFGTSVPAP
jgi:iron complex transport system substrate-binding protein